MSNCNCNNEIIRDGSSQLDRYLQALDPEYTPIDGRSIEDLLVFAKRYAGQIRFYDIPEGKIEDGIPSGKVSWREFFRRDMSVIASSIALINLKQVKKDYEELREDLEREPSQGKYAALYTIILGMVSRIDRWYSVAVPQNPLRTDLDLAIDSNLRAQLHKLIAYEEGYKQIDVKHPLQLDYSGIEQATLWGLDMPIDADAGIYEGDNLADRIRNAALYTDDLFYQFFNFLQELVDRSEQYLQFSMQQYPGHQPHMALFITFLQMFRLAQQQMNGLTGRMLDYYYKEVLQLRAKDALPDKAHIVFELAKEVTEYSLPKGTELKAGKDHGGIAQVYTTDSEIVVNRAVVKELKTLFIEKTPFRATAENKTIQSVYARPIANSADGYGAAFKEPGSKWPTFGKGSIHLADSRRKTGFCLDKGTDATADFGNATQLGFALASPQLLLQGGNRLVSWKLDGFSEIFRDKKLDTGNGDTAAKDMVIILSGAEGWLAVDHRLDEDQFINFIREIDQGRFPQSGFEEPFYFFNRHGYHADENVADEIDSQDVVNTLYVYLPLAAPAVISYSPQLHPGRTFATQWPVMQVLLGPDVKIDEGRYEALNFSDVSLKVKVGSRNPDDTTKAGSSDANGDSTAAPFFDGLKTLTLQNDDGLIAPGKPFDPFTAYPLPGKSLYIGSAEVFNKPLKELSVHIKHVAEQQAANGDGSGSVEERAFVYKTSLLEKRSWNTLWSYQGSVFSERALSADILPLRGYLHSYSKTDRLPVAVFDKVDEHTTKGFVQLQWDYAAFRKTFANDTHQQLQALSLLFQIKEISLSYTSELRHLDRETDQFFHVYPFGTVETYTIPYEPREGMQQYAATGYAYSSVFEPKSRRTLSFDQLDARKEYLLVDAREKLLPQFTYQGVYTQQQTAAPLERSMRKVHNKESSESAPVVVSATRTPDVANGRNQYSGRLQEEGMLFIGLGQALPLQTISMLFQFAEGSAEDEDNAPPVIHWSYLTNNEWRPMRGEDIISDGTYGFQATGILKINLPADATNNNTIVSHGLHWLCASVTEHADRIPMLVDIKTQAATAVFKDNHNDDRHYDDALPAGSIDKLAMGVAQVSKVQQPFSGFDGKHREVGNMFYQRVSERLRHKQRAITAWDYEHLVLDRFAAIYKVKCITHTSPECLCRTAITRSITGETAVYSLLVEQEDKWPDLLAAVLNELLSAPQRHAQIIGYGATTSEVGLAQRNSEKIRDYLVAKGIAVSRITITIAKQKASGNLDVLLSGGELTTLKTEHCCGPQIAPGHILLVPIANLKNRNAVNPLQPKTGRRLLLEIEKYIKEFASPFVKVSAKNPVYEEVLTSFNVQFYSGTDKGYYLKKLNEELVQYLTPWAFDEHREMSFGQKVYASAIINFIEEREYVDFITDFKMGVCKAACCTEPADSGAGNRRFDPADFSGCDEIEAFIGDALNKENGAIVAVPATPRSILVSAARHLIQPYEPPVAQSACEQRQRAKREPPVAEGADDFVPFNRPILRRIKETDAASRKVMGSAANKEESLKEDLHSPKAVAAGSADSGAKNTTDKKEAISKKVAGAFPGTSKNKKTSPLKKSGKQEPGKPDQ